MSPFGVSTMTRASPRPIAYALTLNPDGVARPTAIDSMSFAERADDGGTAMLTWSQRQR
jgi:hypothetical protein